MKKVIFLAILLSACTNIEVQRGAELKQNKIDQITKESSKGDVINLLGSPSSKSSFGEETWYYIFNKRDQNIITDDKVIEQDVLVVTFNADDMVKIVEMYDESKAQKVEYSDKKTATAGHEMGVLEQVLGNVGKFGKGTEGRSPSRTAGGH